MQRYLRCCVCLVVRTMPGAIQTFRSLCTHSSLTNSASSIRFTFPFPVIGKLSKKTDDVRDLVIGNSIAGKFLQLVTRDNGAFDRDDASAQETDDPLRPVGELHSNGISGLDAEVAERNALASWSTWPYIMRRKPKTRCSRLGFFSACSAKNVAR